MKNWTVILLIILVCTGCKSCLGKLYGVHEELTPLNIVFKKKVKSILHFKNFIDSINTSSLENKSIDCNYTSISTDKDDKIVCFYGSICECYLITIEQDRIIIPAVFEPAIDAEAWLTKKEQLSDSVINRIKQRFENEVLDKYDK